MQPRNDSEPVFSENRRARPGGGITITRFTEPHTQAVVAFNARLRAGGMTSQFPTSPVPAWLPPAPGSSLYQEYFVAVDAESVVRGAYILKHQEFQVGTRAVSVADFQLPISEGPVNRAYVGLATQLLLDALGRNPLLYGLGIGGHEEAIARLLKAAGWSFVDVPFFFRVVHPFSFFRRIRYLRRQPWRLGLDLAAFSGLGWLAVQGVQAARTRRPPADSCTVELVDEFGPWADELWQRSKEEYGLIAVRTAAVLQTLYPAGNPRFFRLRLSENNRPRGWCVVLDSRFTDHKQFGSLRVGSVVDGFASTAHAFPVVAAATQFLEQRGVDLIVSNQSHDRWCEAFAHAGYFRGPTNFLFTASPKLTRLWHSSGALERGIYMNRGDGDGPINL